MTMPRYLHYFDVPVTGSFESDEEDFEEALKKRITGLSPLEAIKSLVDDCQIFHALHNIDSADMAENPEVVND